MKIRTAKLADVSALASLNQQLIRDEGHRNPMTLDALSTRMHGWLTSGEYEAAVVLIDDEICAYALYRHEAEYVYLRQLFVLESQRRNGVGKALFTWLKTQAWPTNQRIRIDVLVGNKRAQAFWRSLGFKDYCLTMELD